MSNHAEEPNVGLVALLAEPVPQLQATPIEGLRGDVDGNRDVGKLG